MATIQLDSHRIPVPVFIAAGLVCLHGLLTIANAIALGITAQDWSDVFHAVIRMVGVGAIAWGLVTLQTWGWWLTVIGGGFNLLGNLLGLAALMYFIPSAVSNNIEGNGFTRFVLIGNIVVLVGAIFLLMWPQSRAAFDFGKGPKPVPDLANDLNQSYTNSPQPTQFNSPPPAPKSSPPGPKSPPPSPWS